MRLAIISDTHMPRGGRVLPVACVEHLRAADLILHAGDFIDFPVLADLEAIGPPLSGVRGNVDSSRLQALLPATRLVEAEGVRIAMIHDGGPAEGRLGRLRNRFPKADAVVFGHSHIPLLETAAGFTIFNPGSPTERRRSPRHTMGLATVDHGEITFEHVALD